MDREEARLRAIALTKVITAEIFSLRIELLPALCRRSALTIAQDLADKCALMCGLVNEAVAGDEAPA